MKSRSWNLGLDYICAVTSYDHGRAMCSEKKHKMLWNTIVYDQHCKRENLSVVRPSDLPTLALLKSSHFSQFFFPWGWKHNTKIKRSFNENILKTALGLCFLCLWCNANCHRKLNIASNAYNDKIAYFRFSVKQQLFSIFECELHVGGIFSLQPCREIYWKVRNCSFCE